MLSTLFTCSENYSFVQDIQVSTPSPSQTSIYHKHFSPGVRDRGNLVYVEKMRTRKCNTRKLSTNVDGLSV